MPQPYTIKRFEIISKKWTRIILTEGKNREIRKILSYFGYEVNQLVRMRIGCIELGDLKPGQYRAVTFSEIKSLLRGENDILRKSSGSGW
jgi:23S rRNA pseudouridine2605 synthase